MGMTLSAAAEYLKGQNKFLILTHKNPDGDTIGSAASLCRALRSLGKEAFVYENPGVTSRYSVYLDGLCVKDYAPDCVIAVDIADAKLIPSDAQKYSQGIALAIDHHGTHRGFAKHLLLDADAAACGEILYRLIGALGVNLDLDIASALYLAISTDTGCFLHSSTTPETHRIAAELLALGVDIDTLHREFFVTKSRARLTVESKLIEGMHFYHGGKAAVMQLPVDLIDKAQATEDDLDNISALARSVDGVELGILIRELKDGKCKLSVRSGSTVNAAELCSVFDGGGHVRAAGCTIEASLNDAEAQVCAAIDNLKIFSD